MKKTKEKLVVGINDVYLGSTIKSSVKVMEDKALLKEWLVDDCMALLDTALNQVETNAFDLIRTKKAINKSLELFEPKTITIEPKE